MSDPIRNQRTGFQPEPCQAQALWRVHFHNRPCAHLCDVCKAVMSQSIPAEDITMEMAVSPALHLPCNGWPPMQDYVTIADTVSYQGPPSEANDGPELPLTPDEHQSERFHPGEYLRNELRERHISPLAFAQRSGIAPETLMGIIHETSPVTRPIAEALERIIGTSADCWMNLQAAYDGYSGRGEISQETARELLAHFKQVWKESRYEPRRASFVKRTDAVIASAEKELRGD
jgi:addiction module HigA family antidote